MLALRPSVIYQGRGILPVTDETVDAYMPPARQRHWHIQSDFILIYFTACWYTPKPFQLLMRSYVIVYNYDKLSHRVK